MNSEFDKKLIIADNRKRVKLERLRNPTHDPGYLNIIK